MYYNESDLNDRNSRNAIFYHGLLMVAAAILGLVLLIYFNSCIAYTRGYSTDQAFEKEFIATTGDVIYTLYFDKVETAKYTGDSRRLEYFRWELVFMGMKDDRIKILYREYVATKGVGMAFQLPFKEYYFYRSTNDEIVFRKFVFKLIDCDDNKITYLVAAADPEIAENLFIR